MVKKVLYHGSYVDFNSFTLDFIGSENATDQEGVGIYLTNTKDDATHYGNMIYTVELDSSKIIPLSGKIDISKMTKLIKKAPDSETGLSNYAENKTEALNMFFKLNLEKHNNKPFELIKDIWYDFYRYHPKEFAKNVVDVLGYDYVRIPKDGVEHFIVYNPSILKILNKKKY